MHLCGVWWQGGGKACELSGGARVSPARPGGTFENFCVGSRGTLAEGLSLPKLLNGKLVPLCEAPFGQVEKPVALRHGLDVSGETQLLVGIKGKRWEN